MLSRIERPEVYCCPLAAQVSGNYWYLANADENDFLLVIDFSDTSELKIVGKVRTGIWYMPSLEKQGDYVYVVGDQNAKFQVVNVQDPLRPRLAGSLSLHDTAAMDIAVSGDYAYVADYEGLRIIDVSNPASPSQVSYLPHNECNAVHVCDDRAYVLANYDSLVIVDVSDPAHPQAIGGCALDGGWDIRVQDDVAYIVGDLLLALDVSDPSEPTELARVEDVYAATLELAGNRAYLLGDGLFAYDISDPSAPVLLGMNGDAYTEESDVLSVQGEQVYSSYDEEFWIFDFSDLGPPVVGSVPEIHGKDIALRDTLAFVTEPYEGLTTVNVADPFNPFRLGLFTLSAYPTGVRVQDTLAFVSSYDVGLQVVNVANPLMPSLVGSCTLYSYSNALAVQGARAYVATSDSGVCIINVADPAHPVVMSRARTRRVALDVTVQDSLMFVADADSGLMIVNVRDPYNPVLLSGLTQFYGSAVAVHGSVAFVAGWEYPGWDATLFAVSVADPRNPQVLGRLRQYGNSVTVRDSFAYVTSTTGMYVVNVANPAAMFRVGNTWTDAHAVALRDHYAFVAGYGLQVVDISNPTGGVNTTLLDAPADEGCSFYEAASQGTYLYVASDSGLHCVDVALPESMRVVGTLPAPASGSLALLAPPYVFLATRESLLVVDVMNPSQPTREGSYPGSFTDIELRGFDAYAPYSSFWQDSCGLAVLDISVPVQPALVGLCTLGMRPGAVVRNVALKDSWAYVTGDSEYLSGIYIVNVHDRVHPRLARFFAIDTGYALGLAAAGNYLYVGTGSSGLLVLDITNPVQPVEVTRCPQVPYANDVAFSGNYAAVAAGTAGVQVVDVTDLRNPVRYGYYRDDLYCYHHVLLNGDLAYGGSEYALGAFRVGPTGGQDEKAVAPVKSYLRVAPNPCRSRAKIAYSLAGPGPFTLRLYDISGRLAAVIGHGQIQLGPHVLDYDTRQLPRGVYLLRLESRDFTATRKLIVQ
jgi:hypothetical protein